MNDGHTAVKTLPYPNSKPSDEQSHKYFSLSVWNNIPDRLIGMKNSYDMCHIWYRAFLQHTYLSCHVELLVHALHLSNLSFIYLFFFVYSGLVIPEKRVNKSIPEVTAKSGSVFLHFYSDAAYNMSGFNVSYE